MMSFGSVASLVRLVRYMSSVKFLSAWLFLFTLRFLFLHPSPSYSLLLSHLHASRPTHCPSVSCSLLTSLRHTERRAQQIKNLLPPARSSFFFKRDRSHFSTLTSGSPLSSRSRSPCPSHSSLRASLSSSFSPDFPPASFSVPSISFSSSFSSRVTSACSRTSLRCFSSSSPPSPSSFPSRGVRRFRLPNRPSAAATVSCTSELLSSQCPTSPEAIPTTKEEFGVKENFLPFPLFRPPPELETVPRTERRDTSHFSSFPSKAAIFSERGNFPFFCFPSSLQKLLFSKKALRRRARVRPSCLSPTLRQLYSAASTDESSPLFLPFSWVEPPRFQDFASASLPKRARVRLSLFRRIPKEETLAHAEKRRQHVVLACLSSLLGTTKKTSSARRNEALERTEHLAEKKEKLFAHAARRSPPFSNVHEKFFNTAKKRSPLHCAASFPATLLQENLGVKRQDLFSISANLMKRDKNNLRVTATSAAFVLLDLIKIFGRLAEPSGVGSVIASPVSSPSGVASDVLSVYDRLLRPPPPGRKHQQAGKAAAPAELNIRSKEGGERAAAAGASPLNRLTGRTAAAAAPTIAAAPTSPAASTAEERARVAAAVEAWLAREKARWRHSTYDSLLVQGSKSAYMGKGGCSRRRKWERLFPVPEKQQQQQKLIQIFGKELARDRVLGVGLTRHAFEAQLLQLPFAWPLLPNTGALPAAVPYQPAALGEFLAVCSSSRERTAKAANASKNVEGGRCRIPHYERVNALLQRSLIHQEAIDCVWRAFTTLFHGPFGEVLPAAERSAEMRLLPAELLQYQKSICQIRYLYRGDILRCIWQWAPADGFVDWNSFTFFLDEIPADGIDNMAD